MIQTTCFTYHHAVPRVMFALVVATVGVEVSVKVGDLGFASGIVTPLATEYFGIPFAEPALRFTPPVDRRTHFRTVFNSKRRPSCSQPSYESYYPRWQASEDCLMSLTEILADVNIIIFDRNYATSILRPHQTHFNYEPP